MTPVCRVYHHSPSENRNAWVRPTSGTSSAAECRHDQQQRRHREHDPPRARQHARPRQIKPTCHGIHGNSLPSSPAVFGLEGIRTVGTAQARTVAGQELGSDACRGELCRTMGQRPKAPARPRARPSCSLIFRAGRKLRADGPDQEQVLKHLVGQQAGVHDVLALGDLALELRQPSLPRDRVHLVSRLLGAASSAQISARGRNGSIGPWSLPASSGPPLAWGPAPRAAGVALTSSTR